MIGIIISENDDNDGRPLYEIMSRKRGGGGHKNVEDLITRGWEGSKSYETLSHK